MASRPLTQPLPILGALALAAVFGLHLAQYHPFFADDAFISLRYAQRLLAGDGLTWTAGEAVEGYSNLAWILIVSGLGALGLDLVDAARLLGVLGGGATLLLVYRGRLAGWIAALALALSGPLAVWSIGGLEQPLVAALLAWATVEASAALTDPGRGWRVGAPLALLCLTRPDGPLFVAVFAAGITVQHRALRPALRLVALPIGAVLGQLIFRRLYYADWLPNTAYMKASWSADRLADGLAYVGDGFWTLLPMLGLALLGVLAGWSDRARRGRVLLAGAAALAWTGYVASVGGDIFPAHRHLVPTLVLLAFVGAEGVAWAMARTPDRRTLAIPLVVLVLALLPLQQAAEANARARTERWEWDAVPVARLLRAAFADDDPLLAVTAAGALPYFSKLRCLDMLGLNDRHIARQPAHPGRGIGHDHGDGEYVLDRAPDLMVWGTPKGGQPKHVAGSLVKADPRFARAYRQVIMDGFDPRPQQVTAFVRIEGRVGVTRAPDRITIPGLLFGLPGRAVLDGDAAVVNRIPAHLAVRSPPIAVPPGRWTVTSDPLAGAIGLTVSGDVPFGVGAGVIEGPATVRLAASTSRLPSDLRAIHLERTLAPVHTRARQLIVRPRPSTAAAEAPEFLLHAFNGADPGGWRLEGIPIALAPVPGQAVVRGRAGGSLNSFLRRRGDKARGRAWSPVFEAPPQTALSFRVAGGKQNVGVRLRAKGRIIGQWAGRKDEQLRRVQLDLSAHRGQPLQIEVFDDSSARWGHIIVDDVKLVPWRPAQVVSKRMP